MPILKVEKANDGGTWGFDSEAGKWVPIDAAMMQGSFAGNLGRAAVQGVENIGQGLNELVAQPDNQQVVADREALRAREEQSARSAPWASALGGAAPEVAAGVLAAIPTAGAGLLPALGAQALAGGAIGSLRSAGSNAERTANAAFGAAAGLLGEVIGPAAMKAVAAGASMAEAVTGRAAGKVTREIADGADQVTRARAAAEAAGGDQAQPGSVGAARTPSEQLDPQVAAESQALGVDEATGAEIGNPGRERDRSAAEAHGYRPPWFADTKGGSAARNLAAQGFELLPGSDAVNAGIMRGNEALKGRLAGKALGLGDNSARDVISTADLEQATERLQRGFERVGEELPNISNSAYVRALEKVDIRTGAVGADRAETLIDSMKAKLRRNESAYVEPDLFMRDVQKLTGEMAKAYRDGDTNSGELLGRAVNELYNLGEQETKNAPSRYGSHGRDPDVVSKQWRDLRREFSMLKMLRAPGVLTPEGEINSQALWRQMSKDPKSGGFGIRGPDEGSDARPLFEVIRYDRSAGKTNVPMTGVRAAMQLARMPLAAGLGTSAVMGAGNAIGSLWD
jgi:hypothetical protein